MGTITRIPLSAMIQDTGYYAVSFCSVVPLLVHAIGRLGLTYERSCGTSLTSDTYCEIKYKKAHSQYKLY
eukprot:1424885-Rhodomonas_salina.1